MTCPQCGFEGYAPDRPCPNCGFQRDMEPDPYQSRAAIPTPRRDLWNGFGIGCLGYIGVLVIVQSMLSIASFFGRSLFVRLGPYFDFAIPVLSVGAAYYVLHRRGAPVARGLGYCLMLIIVFALGAAAVCAPHGTKPPTSPDGM